MFIDQGLRIAALEESDLEFCKELRNDPDTWRYLTDISFLTSSGQRSWYQGLQGDKSRKYFIVWEQEERVGLLRCDEIDHLNRSIRIGADVVKEHRGKGIGTRIYKLFLGYCFNYLNMHRVWLEVLSTNEIAIKLYKNVGFELEGIKRDAIFRDGKYIDYIIMSKLE